MFLLHYFAVFLPSHWPQVLPRCLWPVFLLSVSWFIFFVFFFFSFWNRCLFIWGLCVNFVAAAFCLSLFFSFILLLHFCWYPCGGHYNFAIKHVFTRVIWINRSPYLCELCSQQSYHSATSYYDSFRLQHVHIYLGIGGIDPLYHMAVIGIIGRK